MMKVTISFILLATFIATLTLLFSPLVVSLASPETQKRIDFLCRQMEDYQFCNQTFNHDLPNPDTDDVGLTRITIVECQQNSTNTLVFIGDLIRNETVPSLINYYKICANAYAEVQESFDHAFEAFNKGDYKGMYDIERPTAKALANCYTIFRDPSLNASPLDERNKEMRVLLTMAVVMGSFLAK